MKKKIPQLTAEIIKLQWRDIVQNAQSAVWILLGRNAPELSDATPQVELVFVLLLKCPKYGLCYTWLKSLFNPEGSKKTRFVTVENFVCSPPLR